MRWTANLGAIAGIAAATAVARVLGAPVPIVVVAGCALVTLIVARSCGRAWRQVVVGAAIVGVAAFALNWAITSVLGAGYAQVGKVVTHPAYTAVLTIVFGLFAIRDHKPPG